MIVATNTLEHDYNNKFSSRAKPQFTGDTRSIQQLKALNIGEADFKVHFGIIAGGDEDVIDVEAPLVFYINLKIVVENIAFLLYKWLGK